MRIKEIKVYQFNELSDNAKEKAISNLYDINVGHGWWEYTYSDAEDIGLKLTVFDIDRGNYWKGNFIDSAENCAHLIINSHGESCETFKTAEKFLTEITSIRKKYINAGEDNWDELSEIENSEDEFLNDILSDYLTILRKEYEYLTGKDAIIETIEANEYEFLETGELA